MSCGIKELIQKYDEYKESMINYKPNSPSNDHKVSFLMGIEYTLSKLGYKVEDIRKLSVGENMNKVEYEVWEGGGMYDKPISFKDYNAAKDYYEECKTYVRDGFIALTKVTKENLENEFIPYDEED